MNYRTPVAASTVLIAALSMSACGGGDTKAARTSTATVSTSSTTSAPSTSTNTGTSSTPTATSSATSAPTVTKTVQPSPAPVTKTTSAAPAKKDGCYTSDGKSLFLQGVSCGFAQNAYNVYKRGYVPNDTGQYQAYSPKTGKTYTFNCMGDDQGITNCGGGTMAPNSLFSWQG